jgi:phosphatidylserine/phosphatidylglycerophosphate/cardiolipin synthase-like enzyme
VSRRFLFKPIAKRLADRLARHASAHTRRRSWRQGAKIYLDGTKLAEREPAKVFNDLAETPGVEIRIKHKTSAPMHLKSYQIDGRLLRTGAANFSASGLRRQDNDLIVIESAGAAAAFKQTFEARFASGEALPVGPGHDNNLKHY